MTLGIYDKRAALSRVFGHADFRPDQEAIVDFALAGDDVLAVMPTGAGKSLCYQLPAILRPGLTVVISPLIALMRDQVAQLRARGVAAGALNSGNLGGETFAVERAMEERRLKLVYVAPERFGSPGLVDLLKRGGVSMLVIDEAHCISQWGHDFRPEYLALREIAEDLGGPQTMAVTATASEPTRAEIIERLFARTPRVLVSSFDRPNLRIEFARKTDAFAQISTFIGQRRGDSGIIYCASRERTERFAEALSARGHRAIAYHAGLDAETRSAHQDEFLQARGVVMCATIAFGMGIDKSDVRFVCHVDTPGGIEAWYQEIGRAGRDGSPADTLSLWSEDEIARRRRRIEEMTAPRSRAVAELTRLDALASLCRSRTCRRQIFLASFGETSRPCGNCDVCESGLNLFGVGASHPVLMALSASARAVSTRVARLLSGESAELARRRARDLPRRLAARWAPAVDSTGPRVPAASPPTPAPAEDATVAPVAASMSIDERRLLTSLKARRLALARAGGQPARAVCPDEALAAMVVARPRDMLAMADIAGFNRAGLEAYGPDFVAAIVAHDATG